MSFEPSNETELIFLAVFSFVAVEALPDSSPEMPPTTVRSPVIVPPELSSFLATSLLIESIYFFRLVISAGIVVTVAILIPYAHSRSGCSN